MAAGGSAGVSHTRLRWGVLGTASIATRRLIPALHASARNEPVAVASRDEARAAAFAAENGIARSFGSYEALLADVTIDAIYIPLPNHLHLEWSLRAIDAGKHVLCEKPIGLNANEALALRDAANAHPDLKVMEAFMYRCHPRWQRVRQMVAEGAVGELGTVHTVFTYDNRDPADVRNIAELGGGAWLDIGCYGVSVARWFFGKEPLSVHGKMEIDPAFRTDRLTSAVLDFGRGTATVTCATQLAWDQAVSIHGSTGRIEIPLPFNPPGDQPTKIVLHRDGAAEEIAFDACDQFAQEVDQFAAAVLDGAPVPVSLDDSVGNMAALDAIHGGNL
jgi:predicted dehydrogenase